MTNALVQQYETEKNSAVDLIMQQVDVSSNVKNKETSNFSNIMNNLDSRVQKVQNDFDKKAKVTNISSINKKVFDKKDTKIDNKSASNAIDAVKNNLKKDINNKQIVENQKINKQTDNNITTTKTKVESSVNQNDIKISIKDTDKNLSDINNSSPVKSSPVFSSSNINNEMSNDVENEIDKAIEKVENNIQEVLNELPMVQDVLKNVQDLKTQINSSEIDIENIDTVIQKVDSILSSFDNLNLNQETKDNLANMFNQLKTSIQENSQKVDIQTQFQNIINEIENVFDELNIDTNIINELSNETDNQTLENDINSEIELDSNNNKVTKIESDNQIIDEINKVVSEIKSSLKESNLNNDIKNVLAEATKKIDNFESINLATDKTLKNLKDSLVSLNDNLKNLDNFENNELISNDIKIDDYGSTLDLNLDLDIDLDENLSLDNDTKNEILDLLNSFDDKISSFEITDEIKTELKTLIENVSKNTVTYNDIKQAIQNISDDVVSKIDNTELQNNDSIEPLFEIEKVENVVKDFLLAQKENNNINNNQNVDVKNINKTDSEVLVQNKIIKDSTNFDSEIKIDNQDVVLNEDVVEQTDLFDDSEVQLKAKISTDENTKTQTNSNEIDDLEQNLQKQVQTQQMLKDMMVEVDIKTITSQSGALSVADEVAKLAMNESNSLNPITSVHGSITYDGSNNIIKNVASMMKTTSTFNIDNTSMEDVLNQVTNKITQLKDGVTQKLTMVLRPNDLGRLSIELLNNKDGLTTQIMAQNDDVRLYIEKNIESLRQKLADAGVNVNNIQIKTAGQEGSTTYEGNQNLSFGNGQENFNQHNNQNNNKQQNSGANKDLKDVLASINSNYDVQFAKDFSNLMNKSLNYGVN